MCGISGILCHNDSFRGEPRGDLHFHVSMMNDELAHRGPDGDGVHVNYPVALGHRRLSILDLSEAGAQPMFNEDKSIAIVFNGEIYNYLELMPDLIARGHRFYSRSDTEVILCAYEEYGPACVTRFNGMWAFVIYDFRKRLLFASRDRLGVKPFYYHNDTDAFVFSSEIKAILKVVKIDRANHGKVYDYLAYGYKTNNGETFFEAVHELPSAHNLIIQNGQLKLERYWDLPESGPGRDDALDGQELTDRFTALLTDAVRLRFRSDVPVAILLSGGLDSTSITRIVDDLIENRSLDYTTVKAFSAVFPGFVHDESGAIGEFSGTCRHIESHVLTPDGHDLVDRVAPFVYGMGEPVFSATAFAHYMLLKDVRRQGIKVVINGQGSDEAFCGYDRFLIGYFLLDILFSRSGDIVSQWRSIHRNLGYPTSYIVAQLIKAMMPRRMASYLRGRFQEGIIDYLDDRFVRNNYGYLKDSLPGWSGGQRLTEYLKFNIRHYGFNQILHYEDHSSMQNSVEMRSPFVDYRMMEFAFSLPTRFKFDQGVTKRIIRDAFRKKLPTSIVEPHSKIGFAVPFAKWLEEPRFGRFVADIVHSEAFRSRAIWDAAALRRVFGRKESFTQFPFWRVLNLELWSRAYAINNL